LKDVQNDRKKRVQYEETANFSTNPVNILYLFHLNFFSTSPLPWAVDRACSHQKLRYKAQACHILFPIRLISKLILFSDHLVAFIFVDLIHFPLVLDYGFHDNGLPLTCEAMLPRQYTRACWNFVFLFLSKW